MAKAPRYASVTAGTGFSEAARIVLGIALDAAFDPLPAVLRGDDTRAVHDMRVALRRLRTGLTTFEDCFERRSYRPVRRALRDVAARLGAVRDADVHLAALRGALGGAAAGDRAGIAFAIEELATRRRLALAAFAIELSQFDREACAALLKTP